MLSLMQATCDPGFHDAGYMLQAPRKAGLRPVQLDDQVVDEQACRGLGPLRDALKVKPSR